MLDKKGKSDDCGGSKIGEPQRGPQFKQQSGDCNESSDKFGKAQNDKRKVSLFRKTKADPNNALLIAKITRQNDLNSKSEQFQDTKSLEKTDKQVDGVVNHHHLSDSTHQQKQESIHIIEEAKHQPTPDKRQQDIQEYDEIIAVPVHNPIPIQGEQQQKADGGVFESTDNSQSLATKRLDEFQHSTSKNFVYQDVCTNTIVILRQQENNKQKSSMAMLNSVKKGRVFLDER
ncbi:hypothetical protein FGO68_gene2769 [Halteria grandinella]|uniref:Uncharacterized protein n=1 Tax=Halteria grandinella TaxID=5974 RepID=A0A8J8P260_HALGN|nr:hypothetical protein FGO68_gene2769 [Halteria grandinella]